MTETYYITSSCRLFNGLVLKNGERVFENAMADCQQFLLKVYEFLDPNYPRFYKMDKLAKLGWLGAEILLNPAFDKAAYQPEDIGLLFCNSSGSLDTDLKYYETVKTMASPALFVYTLPNIVLGEICIRHNFKGENDFFIFDAFNPAFVYTYLNQLLETGVVEACLCGWLEVLGEHYDGCLYLVEKKQTASSIPFNTENIHHIYQTTHGSING